MLAEEERAQASIMQLSNTQTKLQVGKKWLNLEVSSLSQNICSAPGYAIQQQQKMILYRLTHICS